MYIGESSRKIQERIKEHLDAYLDNTPQKSAFAEHLLENDHNPTNITSTLLHIENSFRRRLALEKYEILKHLSDPNVNVLNKFIPEGGILEKLISYTT